MTDLSRRNPEVDFQKIRKGNRTFYLVRYDIYFTPDVLNISVEPVFAGEVVGTCTVAL